MEFEKPGFGGGYFGTPGYAHHMTAYEVCYEKVPIGMCTPRHSYVATSNHHSLLLG